MRSAASEASMREDQPGYVHDLHYFEGQYAGDADPWGFDSRWYEQRKQALTLALLPEPRARRALEPGCANGTLTVRLADRCDELIAYDLIDEPLQRARERTADMSHVRVLQGRLPELWPGDGGDLVVWSEVAYYLSDAAADVAASHLQRWLWPGGSVVAVHWTGGTDYPRSGAAVGRWLDHLPFLQRRSRLEEPEFEAGVWTREPGG
ncbi:SAM-dependent methyltransferase [soil metagenome]